MHFLLIPTHLLNRGADLDGANVHRMRHIDKCMNQDVSWPQRILLFDLQAQVAAQARQLVAHFVVVGVDAQLMATEHIVHIGVHRCATAWAEPVFQCIQRQPHAQSGQKGPRARRKADRTVLGAHEGRVISCAVRCVERLQGAEAIRGVQLEMRVSLRVHLLLPPLLFRPRIVDVIGLNGFRPFDGRKCGCIQKQFLQNNGPSVRKFTLKSLRQVALRRRKPKVGREEGRAEHQHGVLKTHTTFAHWQTSQQEAEVRQGRAQY